MSHPKPEIADHADYQPVIDQPSLADFQAVHAMPTRPPKKVEDDIFYSFYGVERDDLSGPASTYAGRVAKGSTPETFDRLASVVRDWTSVSDRKLLLETMGLIQFDPEPEPEPNPGHSKLNEMIMSFLVAQNAAYEEQTGKRDPLSHRPLHKSIGSVLLDNASNKHSPDRVDAILTIVEKLDIESARNILAVSKDLITESQRVSQWFKGHDKYFGMAFRKAFQERVADGLFAVAEVARTGSLAMDVSPGKGQDRPNHRPHNISVESVADATQILQQLHATLKQQNNIITDTESVVTKVADSPGNFTMYRYVSPQYGQALLYIRPEGAKGYDPALEYGTARGIEASISFITNPDDPHAYLDPYKDKGGVSIRFDREGRGMAESPFSDRRDPTREDGIISLDVSSLMGSEDSTGVRIGRFIAAGNALWAQQVHSANSLHHNTRYFDQEKYGSREGFADLAHHVMKMADAQVHLGARH